MVHTSRWSGQTNAQMIAEVDITVILSMLIAKFVQLDVVYVPW